MTQEYNHISIKKYNLSRIECTFTAVPVGRNMFGFLDRFINGYGVLDNGELKNQARFCDSYSLISLYRHYYKYSYNYKTYAKI